MLRKITIRNKTQPNRLNLNARIFQIRMNSDLYIIFNSLGYVLHIGPFHLQIFIQFIRPHLLLKNDDRLHQRVEGLMQFLPRVAQQVVRQLEPDLQHWELLQHIGGNIPQLFLVLDTLLQKLVDLLLVIFYVINRQDLRVSIPTK